jgi:murein DD-endopeptidase MepM/ murein hydrolase activator NlpD
MIRSPRSRAGVVVAALAVILPLGAGTARADPGPPPTTLADAPTTTVGGPTTVPPTTVPGSASTTTTTPGKTSAHAKPPADAGGDGRVPGSKAPAVVYPFPASAIGLANGLLDASVQLTPLSATQQRLLARAAVSGRDLAAARARRDAAWRIRRVTSAAAVAAQHRVDRARTRVRAFALEGYLSGTEQRPSALVVAVTGGDSSTGESDNDNTLRLTTRDAVVAELKASTAVRDAAVARDDLARRRLVAATATRDRLAHADASLARRVAILATRVVGASQDADRLRAMAGSGIDVLDGGSIGVTLATFQQRAVLSLPHPFLSAPLSPLRLVSNFGFRIDPIGGGVGFHPGVDFAASAGTPIRAAAGGTVVIASAQGGYGNCTVIAHVGGLGTLYAHQSRIAVRVGQQVKRGDVIGYVGSTGASTGPHLHFEVRVLGALADPLPWLDPPLARLPD